MRLGIASILALLCATSLFAQEKKEPTKASVLADLASANSFEKPGAYKGADDWNKAVDSVGGLVAKNPDKALQDGFTALTHANNDLVNAFKIASAQCIGSEQFLKVETAAAKAKTALKKPTFVLPGKRATREVLVALADYIAGAAKIGSSRAQICRNLTVLLDLPTKLDEVEAARRNAHENINKLEKAKAELRNTLKAVSDAEKKYVASREKRLAEIKADQKRKQILDATAKLKAAKLATAENELKGLYAKASGWEYYISGTAETIELDAKILKLKEKLGEIASNIQNIDETLLEQNTEKKDIKESYKLERQKLDGAIEKASNAVVQTKQSLEPTLVLAEYKSLEDQAKKVCGITQVTAATLNGCKPQILDSIKKAAPGAKLEKQCGSLTENDGLVDIKNICGKAAGKV